MRILPSSPDESTRCWSNGSKAVSSTLPPVWPLNIGTLSGALPTSSTGITVNDPIPFAFNAMYTPLHWMMLLSNADSVGLRFS